MQDVLKNLQNSQALIVTAPPGWGKTYHFLKAIKSVKKLNVIFIFPLRALCDEVYLKAIEFSISTANIRKMSDYDTQSLDYFRLILCTPELCDLDRLSRKRIIILDEFHLFYYWGDTFRPALSELFYEICSHGYPLVLLSATLNKEFIERLNFELRLNYENYYYLNFGNQLLKNIPYHLIYYPKLSHLWIWDDIFYAKRTGISLVFCQFRNQVRELSLLLKNKGFHVLSCVGGEAKDFCIELEKQEKKIDYIVATSVVSHGVNLPSISKVYLTYKIANIDFYLQMIGRGGRDGARFELHTMNFEYFSKYFLLKGFLKAILKKLQNRLNCYIFSLYES